MPNSALPPNLKGKSHSDYPPGLRWIPRAWTAWKWGEPVLVFGTGTKPINPPGGWQVSRFLLHWFAWYFAFTTRGGTHFRIGARWDDVDDYVEWPTIAIKFNVK